jgi:hypothetical protein
LIAFLRTGSEAAKTVSPVEKQTWLRLSEEWLRLAVPNPDLIQRCREFKAVRELGPATKFSAFGTNFSAQLLVHRR